MRWIVGLLAFFATIIGMNVVLIYLALDDPPEMAPSYEHTAR